MIVEYQGHLYSARIEQARSVRSRRYHLGRPFTLVVIDTDTGPLCVMPSEVRFVDNSQIEKSDG